jgi:phosphoribosylformylglycinamidine cyclo-ligase
MYAAEDYDLAGFSVGVVERARLIDGSAIQAGDTVLGIASSGLHSNGFSLVRKIINDARLGFDECPAALGGETIAAALLRPTEIYVAAVRAIQAHYRVKQVLHGIAHITGGGLGENLERILPAGVDAQVDPTAWEVPPIFRWLQELGEVADAEMERVFNMGIGLVLVVSPYYAGTVADKVAASGFPCVTIGEITEGNGKVRYRGG